jgi:hypothetical protein
MVLATHCIRQFPLHFPSRASPCAITFQLDSTTIHVKRRIKLLSGHPATPPPSAVPHPPPYNSPRLHVPAPPVPWAYITCPTAPRVSSFVQDGGANSCYALRFHALHTIFGAQFRRLHFSFGLVGCNQIFRSEFHFTLFNRPFIASVRYQIIPSI